MADDPLLIDKSRRIHDAVIAATALAHGITNLCTLNPGDFAGFGLRVLDPRDPACIAS